MTHVGRILLAAALAAGGALTTAPASAQVSFGIGIGVPLYPAYPVYPYAYDPPAHYPAPAFVPRQGPPPPSTPVPREAVGAGGTCYAGAYVCPLERPATPGSACACLAPNGIRAWGRVGG